MMRPWEQWWGLSLVDHIITACFRAIDRLRWGFLLWHSHRLRLIKFVVWSVRRRLLHITDFIQFYQFFFSVRWNELLDNHVAAANSDDKLTVKNFSINLPSTEKIIPFTELFDWDWAARFIDVLAKHLVQNVALMTLVSATVLLLLLFMRISNNFRLQLLCQLINLLFTFLHKNFRFLQIFPSVFNQCFQFINVV